jgi:hypothetical protein
MSYVNFFCPNSWIFAAVFPTFVTQMLLKIFAFDSVVEIAPFSTLFVCYCRAC